MTPAHRRYILVEATVSAAINAVLSIAFVLLLLRTDRVAVDALVRDAVPQSFMIALMASLVPTLLTRRRLRVGAITSLRSGPPLGDILLASVVTAVVVALVAGAVHWAVLPLLLKTAVPFAAVLVAKALYGAALGAGVTVLALTRALTGGGHGNGLGE